MAHHDYPRIEITPYWARMTLQLVEITGALSEEELDQRPSPGVWSVREHMEHIIGARNGVLDSTMREVERRPDIRRLCETRNGLQEELQKSWARIAAFLARPDLLDALYTPEPPDPERFRQIAEGPPDYPTEPAPYSGHFIAYHRLVHDAHHRACIFNVIEQLGIELRGVRRLHPL